MFTRLVHRLNRQFTLTMPLRWWKVQHVKWRPRHVTGGTAVGRATRKVAGNGNMSLPRSYA